MTAAQHLGDIVQVARKYRDMYPDWSAQQALDVAVSEYDCHATFTEELRQQALAALQD